jgi:phosphoglycolate phosphatase-like HAD superfamily hydrolase
MSTVETNPANNKPADWLDFSAYIFDIDGTLLSSAGMVHYNAFKAALHEIYGCHRDITEVPMHGNTDIGILRATTRLAGVDDDTFAARLPEALEFIRNHAKQNQSRLSANLCPSIPEMVAHLHGTGKLLGLATGNLEVIGWMKIEAAGLRKYFDFGAFSDRHEKRSEIFATALTEARRRLGEDARVCFVGDTPADIDAAHTNGCAVIAVATGIHPFDQLQALSPEFCLRRCDELLTI